MMPLTFLLLSATPRLRALARRRGPLFPGRLLPSASILLPFLTLAGADPSPAILQELRSFREMGSVSRLKCQSSLFKLIDISRYLGRIGPCLANCAVNLPEPSTI